MLLTEAQLAVVVPMMFLAAISPGPDVLYIVGQAAGSSRRQGIVAVAGVATGLLIHTLAAALGLSSLFLHVPMAYLVLKGAGVAYLVYLAWKLVQAPGESGVDAGAVPGRPLRRLRAAYVQGLLTNLLNPKAVLFFLGVLPQFADATRPDVPQQLVALSLVATATVCTAHLLVAGVAYTGFARLKVRAAAWGRWPNYALAAVFGGLAVRLALSERPQ
jgi:threonine/homoserine/homoserine lactone efflux protein